MEEVTFKVGDKVRIEWSKTGVSHGRVTRLNDSDYWPITVTTDLGTRFAFEPGGKVNGTQYLFHAGEVGNSTAPGPSGGLRYDSDKLRLDLIPTEWTVELARVMTIGAYKYADRNWEKGMSWSKCIGCLERHFARWKSGHLADRETKCHELAMVAWNALALMTYELRGLGTDDRVTAPYDTDFKWTEGPGTELGLSAEQIADLKSKFKKA